MLTMGGPVRCWDLEDDVAMYSTHLRPQRVLMFCLTKALGRVAGPQVLAVLCSADGLFSERAHVCVVRVGKSMCNTLIPPCMAL